MLKRSISVISAIALIAVWFHYQTPRVYAALPLIGSLSQSASIISRWYLDEASGTRVDTPGTNDLTDNNTVTGATCQFSVDCSDFETSNEEFLDIADASQTGLDFSADITFCVWIQYEADTLDNRGIFGKWSAASRAYSFWYEGSTTDLFRLQLKNAAAVSVTRSYAYDLPTATWKHLCIVYRASAGEGELYIDGASVSTQTGYGTDIMNGTAAFSIGAYGEATTGERWDGLMQDAIIWNLGLTDAEVDAVYDAYFAVASTGRPMFMILD